MENNSEMQGCTLDLQGCIWVMWDCKLDWMVNSWDSVVNTVDY